VYFYFSARILPVIIALFMFYRLLASPGCWRRWVGQTALLSLGAAMAVSPLVTYLHGEWGKFTGHTEEKVIFHNWESVGGRYGTTEPVAVLWNQLKVNLLAFVNSDNGGQFFDLWGGPLLNKLTASLFLLGLALVIFRAREARYALVFFWFWTSLIFGGVL